MPGKAATVSRLYVSIVEWIIVACLAVMVAVTFASTAMRFIPGQGGLFWAEEITRYANIWMVFLAAGLGVRLGVHLRVDVVVHALPPPGRRVLEVLACLVMLVFEGVLVWFGTKVALINMDQQATSLEFPMGIVYAAIPVGGAVMMFETLRRLLHALRAGGPADPATAQDGIKARID